MTGNLYKNNRNVFLLISRKTRFSDDRVKIMEEYKRIYNQSIKVKEGGYLKIRSTDKDEMFCLQTSSLIFPKDMNLKIKIGDVYSQEFIESLNLLLAGWTNNIESLSICKSGKGFLISNIIVGLENVLKKAKDLILNLIEIN